jgi:hypothetical protein
MLTGWRVPPPEEWRQYAKMIMVAEGDQPKGHGAEERSNDLPTARLITPEQH